jgi:hypothetical protein
VGFLFKKARLFFSDFPFYFNAANISLLSPKVAAGAFVEELDDVFLTDFTFFSSSSRKIAVWSQLLFEFFVEFDYFEISSIAFQFLSSSFQGDELE